MSDRLFMIGGLLLMIVLSIMGDYVIKIMKHHKRTALLMVLIGIGLSAIDFLIIYYFASSVMRDNISGLVALVAVYLLLRGIYLWLEEGVMRSTKGKFLVYGLSLFISLLVFFGIVLHMLLKYGRMPEVQLAQEPKNPTLGWMFGTTFMAVGWSLAFTVRQLFYTLWNRIMGKH